MDTQIRFSIICIIILLLNVKVIVAQKNDSTNNFKRHEIGIDVASALTFLKKNTQSYLLNYRYRLTRNTAIRAGLNFDISNGKDAGIYPDVRLGIQRNNRIQSWNLYYGMDLSYSYFKSNAVPVVTKRYGGSPLFGVQYFFSDRISISSECTLNYYYFKVTNNDSFDPESNYDYYRLNLGSVGMAVISYHF